MGINIEIKPDKILKELKIGNSFRLFGGFSLLISLWTGNELALKISLITFIFGAIARAIETLNRLYPKNTILQFVVWIVFLILYSFFINIHVPLAEAILQTTPNVS